MFCDRCGTAALPNQTTCAKCGRQFYIAPAYAYPAANRVASHHRLLGIFWIALSALNLLGGLVLLIVGNAFIAHLHDFGAPPQFPVGAMHALVVVIAFIAIGKAAFGAAAGVGLLKFEPWARILTIVLAVLSLLSFPFGTALGIYSMWVLLPSESEREYEVASRQVNAA